MNVLGTEYGQYVGCFRNEKSDKTVIDHTAEFQDTNAPMRCVNYCMRSGDASEFLASNTAVVISFHAFSTQGCIIFSMHLKLTPFAFYKTGKVSQATLRFFLPFNISCCAASLMHAFISSDAANLLWEYFQTAKK